MKASGMGPIIFVIFLLTQQLLQGMLPAISMAIPQDISLQDRVQYRPGDILIGAALQITAEDVDGECVMGSDASQWVEVINMIIDQVNSNPAILKGVTLGTIMIDTCGSEAHTLKMVITDILPLVWSGSNCTNCDRHFPLAGVVGASYSSVSMQLARILQVFQIPQVSYYSTSVELSDKKRFPYFFRSVASDIHQVQALIHFIKGRNWNYISVVYDNDDYGVDGYSELVRVAALNDICIAYSKSINKITGEYDSEDVIHGLLSNGRARVVVLFTVSKSAENLLSASQRIANGNSLVWIGVDGWIGVLPRDNTNNKYLDVLDGVIGFVPKLESPPNFTEYITSLTLQDNYGKNLSRNPWFAEHISKENNCSLRTDASKQLRRCDMMESLDPAKFKPYDSPISDAIYAFVYALHEYHKVKCKGQANFCDEIKKLAGTSTLASELKHYLKNVSFTGIGGRKFTFDDSHDGPPTYDALMFSKDVVGNKSNNLLDGWIKVGSFVDNKLFWKSRLSDEIDTVNSSCSDACKKGQAKIRGSTRCCWFCQKCTSYEYVHNYTKCESCPLGYKPNEEINGCIPLPKRILEHTSPHSIFILSLGAFGLLCTIIVTVIFIIFRDTAIVRASGKELCFFVLMGIFVTLCNCFTVTLYPSQISCIFTRIILAIGPSCMYVGLLMKTIRVVFIFQSKRIMKTRTKRYLQPMEFTFITSGVASMQIIVLIIWFILETPSVDIYISEDYVFSACKTLMNGKILFGLVYPFLIIIICTILATVNRNVPTGFRETLFIGFAMYTTCIIWLAFIPIFSTNSSDIPLKLTTVSASLSFSAITVLFCLFAPRCHVILFNPTMNTAESVMSKRTPPGSTMTPEVTARPPITDQVTEASQIPMEHTPGGQAASEVLPGERK